MSQRYFRCKLNSLKETTWQFYEYFPEGTMLQAQAAASDLYEAVDLLFPSLGLRSEDPLGVTELDWVQRHGTRIFITLRRTNVDFELMEKTLKEAGWKESTWNY